MIYRFDHTFFYENKKMESLNEMLNNFGMPGKIGLTGNLGHTDIILNPKPGTEFVPLPDDAIEKIREKLEEIVGEKINEADIRLTVKVEKGRLLA